MDADQDMLDESSVSIITVPSDLEDSVDSYINNDGIADVPSCDEWDGDSYYDASTDHYDDSTYESFPLALDEATDDSFVQAFNMPPAADIYAEALEENNNDPNNNMDSNEVDDAQQMQFAFEQSSESGIVVDRMESPKPGCSKDSMPHPLVEKSFASKTATCNKSIIQKQTERIMYLISMINEDSIMEAVKKNPSTLATEIKVWDLVPDENRKNYCDENAFMSKPVLNVYPLVYNGGKNVSGTVKRGPVEDICTVGCKKSSDMDISLPRVSPMGKTARGHSDSIKSRLSQTASQIPVPVSVPKPDLHVQKDRAAFYRSLNLPATYESVPTKSYENVMKIQRVLAASTSVVDTSKGAIPKVQKKSKAEGNENRVKRSTQSNDIPYTICGSLVSNPFNKLEAEQKMHPVVSSLLSKIENDQKIQSRDSMMKSLQDPIMITAQHAENPVETAVGPSVVFTASTPKEKNQEKAQQHPQSTDRPVCMEMFYKLRTMFPNISSEYLKKLCPPEWGPGDREAQLIPIVEHLLSNGENLPRTFPVANDSNDLQEQKLGNVDDIYENLLGIFPDADPHYLRDFALVNVNNPNAVKEFVEQKLEKRDYPTRQQYLDRLKITEQQKQYTTGFDVKQFLSIIPDPFKHFMDPKRRSNYNTVAFEFLKSQAIKMRVTTISKVYRDCHHNLSLAIQKLESLPDEMKTKRYSPEMPTEDIGLLQEIAFIKNRMQIKNHIESIKQAETEEFNRLKTKNALIECQCCYDSECLPSKCSSCEFGHVFCNSCVVNGTNAKIGEGETRIRCFADCDKEFSLSTLQRILPPTSFSILLKKRQAAEVMEAGLEGLVACPFCHFASIPPENDKTFKCLNPECTKESCRLCKELSHLPLKCEEVVSTEKARRYVEERMTEAYARKCYKCQKPFIKEEGCNLITCSCGAKMCYLCDAQVNNYSHFRGQGSNSSQLCPLWGDTPVVDAMAVRKIAEEAQKEVMKLHPNIKIDTTKLLPEVPKAKNGPHVDIVNAYEAPRRIQRDPNIRLV